MSLAQARKKFQETKVLNQSLTRTVEALLFLARPSTLRLIVNILMSPRALTSPRGVEDRETDLKEFVQVKNQLWISPSASGHHTLNVRQREQT